MNKPVAWMMKSNDPDYVSDYIMFKTPERKDKISHQAIALYTHPAKTLTDEEIQEVAHGFGAIGWMGDTTYEFARAILRKALEK
jgi:hypothetical protein